MSSAGSEVVATYARNTSPRFGQVTTISRPPVSTRVIRDLVRMGDLVLLLAAGLLAWLPLADRAPPSGPFFVAGAVAVTVALVTFSRVGIYSLAFLINPVRSAWLTAGTLGLGAVAAAGVLTLNGVRMPVSAGWAAGWAACAGATLLLARLMTLSVLRHYQSQGRLSRKMAIVGVNELSAALISHIDMTTPNTSVVGLYVERDEEVATSQAGVPVLGGLDDLIIQSRVQAIDTIVVALPLVEHERVERICDRLREVACDVFLTADVVGLRYRASALSEIDGHPVIVVRQRPLKDWQGVQKRLFDLFLGWTFLAILAPVMAAIALAIKFDSAGPVLFRQRRLGFNNNVITV